MIYICGRYRNYTVRTAVPLSQMRKQKNQKKKISITQIWVMFFRMFSRGKSGTFMFTFYILSGYVGTFMYQKRGN